MKFTKRAGIWIVLLLLTDLVFIFVVWIMRSDAMQYMLPFILLYNLLVCAVGIFI